MGLLDLELVGCLKGGDSKDKKEGGEKRGPEGRKGGTPAEKERKKEEKEEDRENELRRKEGRREGEQGAGRGKEKSWNGRS